MSGITPVVVSTNLKGSKGPTTPVTPTNPKGALVNIEECCIPSCEGDVSVILKSFDGTQGGNPDTRKGRVIINFEKIQTPDPLNGVVSDVVQDAFGHTFSALTNGTIVQSPFVLTNNLQHKNYADLDTFVNGVPAFTFVAASGLNLNQFEIVHTAGLSEIIIRQDVSQAFENIFQLINKAPDGVVILFPVIVNNRVIQIPFTKTGIFTIYQQQIQNGQEIRIQYITNQYDIFNKNHARDFWQWTYNNFYGPVYNGNIYQLGEGFISLYYPNDTIFIDRIVKRSACEELFDTNQFVPRYLQSNLVEPDFSSVFNINMSDVEVTPIRHYGIQGGGYSKVYTYTYLDPVTFLPVLQFFGLANGVLTELQYNDLPEIVKNGCCKDSCCGSAAGGGVTAEQLAQKLTQGGDAFGVAVIVGSKDNNNVQVKRNGILKIDVAEEAVKLGNRLQIEQSTNVDNGPEILIVTEENKGVGIIIPAGPNSTRPTIGLEAIRFNTSINEYELYFDNLVNPNQNLGVWRVINNSVAGAINNFFQQGGNSFNSTAIFGTQDNNSIEVIVNNNVVLKIEPNGQMTFGSNQLPLQDIDMLSYEGCILMPGGSTSTAPDPVTTYTKGGHRYDIDADIPTWSDGSGWFAFAGRSSSEIEIAQGGIVKLLQQSATSGQVLAWNSSLGRFAPQTVTSGGGGLTAVAHDTTLVGDGTATDQLKIAQQAATNNQYLGWDSVLQTWKPKTLPSGGVDPASLIFIKMSLPSDTPFSGGSALVYWKQYGGNSNLSEFYNRTLWDISSGSQATGLSTGNYYTLNLKPGRKYRISLRLTVTFTAFPQLGDIIELRLNTQSTTTVQSATVTLAPSHYRYTISLDSVIVNLSDITISLYCSNVFSAALNKQGSEIIIEEVF